jgi:hypothetical protein
LILATYVVAIRREERLGTVTAEERVRQVSGVHVKGAGNPNCVIIEATDQAISEIERRFGDKVIVEPEIRHERFEE